MAVMSYSLFPELTTQRQIFLHSGSVGREVSRRFQRGFQEFNLHRPTIWSSSSADSTAMDTRSEMAWYA